MVDLGITEPKKEPTDWVNGLVIVQKPHGKLRICLDFRPLNNAIKGEHIHLPAAKKFFFTNVRYLLFFKSLMPPWDICK